MKFTLLVTLAVSRIFLIPFLAKSCIKAVMWRVAERVVRSVASVPQVTPIVHTHS